jgi:hypothetical protein
MTTRTSAIAQLIEHIQTHSGSRGHRGMRFLHEINDFPQFYVHAGRESRTHIGRGVRLCVIETDIRGYVYSDSFEDIEAYARSIEHAIQSFRPSIIDEARVLSLSTDEGLMRPYALCDISAQILYRIYND